MKNKISVIGWDMSVYLWAAAFSEKYPFLGYDNDSDRLKELNMGWANLRIPVGQ